MPSSKRVRRERQRTAAFRAALRRRLVWTQIEEATQSSVAEVVVLQKDFANVVSSPTAGYIQAEIVITGNTISIYVPPP